VIHAPLNRHAVAFHLNFIYQFGMLLSALNKGVGCRREAEKKPETKWPLPK
jgi:hypothetical protein